LNAGSIAFKFCKLVRCWWFRRAGAGVNKEFPRPLMSVILSPASLQTQGAWTSWMSVEHLILTMCKALMLTIMTDTTLRQGVRLMAEYMAWMLTRNHILTH
jgi:hypothetical protein